MTLILPLCYSFHPSLCLLAPSFVPALFLRSSITLYLSSLLSFTRVSRPSLCRSHVSITRTFGVSRIPGIDESPLSFSTPLLSVQLLPPSISSTSFRPLFTLLPSFPPSFFCHPPCNRPF